jgi:hypothetical protein
LRRSLRRCAAPHPRAVTYTTQRMVLNLFSTQ